jgi:hypothetical protein
MSPKVSDDGVWQQKHYQQYFRILSITLIIFKHNILETVCFCHQVLDAERGSTTSLCPHVRELKLSPPNGTNGVGAPLHFNI